MESKISPSTMERIFSAKVKLILALQDLRFTGDSYQDYRTGLVESVAAASKALPMENFAVREKRVYVEKYAQPESFSSLTEKDVRNLSEQIAPLIIFTDPDDKAKAFDAAMYLLMLSVINGAEKPAARAIKRTMTISSKLAKKGAAIPQILAQKELIEQVQTSTFWDGVSILEIENVRVNLRDLIKFLDDSGHKVYINLQDEILAVFEGGAVYDYETADEDYKNKVNQYVNKHKEHIAIYKLMNNIPLTQTDYSSLCYSPRIMSGV
ncbi:hypothetical protein [Sporomusa sp.]|uniref:hypothetical protein n=1 Tax=Sporomusa sp. TaxID=2078658 RepID=UPI002BD22B74|nr:hypothetical protein [Sporomusa sp.]HWR09291.1 hypothetical protein [Sporomusa sp.]